MRGPGDLKTVRDLGPNVGGFYSASSAGIAAFVDEKADNWDDADNHVLFHEIAHHFMMQYRPTAYPPWYVEGFAEYVMTARFKPKTIEYGWPAQGRAAWLGQTRWLPVEKILFARPPRKGPDTASFYAQSWLIAHYMLRDAERGTKFRAYINALVHGEEPKAAFTAQFGDIDAFGRAVQAYARKGMTYTTRTRASAAVPPPVTMSTLPGSADALLLREAAMHIGVGDENAPQHLARIRAEAAKFASDPYAKRVLAEAEILYGDREKGAKLADELLGATPSDVELLYLRGMRHVLDARAAEDDAVPAYKAARGWFVRAHKADPNHFPTLARYAESLRTDGRFDSDNTMEIVLLAQQLAPQVDEISMLAASLMIMRGHFSEAEAMLLPLASSPHDEGLATAASAMLRQARAKSKSPLPDGDEPAVETASQ
ncbi:lipopolysaccharide assembly protein LapB [Sphingosinicella sp. BN140058]|uniref:tetratricopeptide repeat protein n=1 Tax=Sphingosinicella sp. BN140058 TaxID=1892855 RepID=UPI00101105F8|nr:hypothetical protein [Sphingosinicella sp. BN140058]QAY79344.1 hypothetical protein ETR14_24475 [Sphingosinicella sp. BN140058]